MRLNSLIREIVSFMQPQALLHKAEIKVHFDNDVNDFVCQPNQLKQLFMNILNNAIEAMPKGGRIDIFTLLEPA